MAGNNLLLYPSNGTLTITLASLAFAASPYLVGQASTAVSNATSLAVDALVQVMLKNGSGTITTPFGAFVYAYGSADGGSHYDDGVTGTNAAFTSTSPANLAYLGFVNMPVSATQYTSRTFSVAAAFGGTLPQDWGIVVINAAGVNFDSTAGNHAARYQLVAGSYT